MLRKYHVSLIIVAVLLGLGCSAGSGVNQQSKPAQQPGLSGQTDASQPSPAVSPSLMLEESRNSLENANWQPTSATINTGACRLLTSEEIQAVQGEAVKEAKGSEPGGSPINYSQCFYVTPTFNRSVSLGVGRKDPNSRENVKEVWEERFRASAERDEKDKKLGSREEDEENSAPPKRVSGVGDDAYWVGNSKTGMLYVLKNEKLLRISIGGPDEQQAKINKLKTLARQALKRL